jgi:hypothetical protein
MSEHNLQKENYINEISNFLEDYAAVYPEDPNTDIFRDLQVTGDDFHEMIEKFAEHYKVDMTGYLWYFHANEEGFSITGPLFKPPYERVKRIPVTPQMLADFAITKKWDMHYPAHSLPRYRVDLIIGTILVAAIVISLGVWFLTV